MIWWCCLLVFACELPTQRPPPARRAVLCLSLNRRPLITRPRRAARPQSRCSSGLAPSWCSGRQASHQCCWLVCTHAACGRLQRRTIGAARLAFSGLACSGLACPSPAPPAPSAAAGQLPETLRLAARRHPPPKHRSPSAVFLQAEGRPWEAPSSEKGSEAAARPAAALRRACSRRGGRCSASRAAGALWGPACLPCWLPCCGCCCAAEEHSSSPSSCRSRCASRRLEPLGAASLLGLEAA